MEPATASMAMPGKSRGTPMEAAVSRAKTASGSGSTSTGKGSTGGRPSSGTSGGHSPDAFARPGAYFVPRWPSYLSASSSLCRSSFSFHGGRQRRLYSDRMGHASSFVSPKSRTRTQATVKVCLSPPWPSTAGGIAFT
jgi:hypothetical protein